jgi:hypothetical protein
VTDIPTAGALVAVITFAVITLAVVCSRDLMAPHKIYFGILVLTFGEVVLKPQSIEIYLIYLSLLLLGVFALVMERVAAGRQQARHSETPMFYIRKDGVLVLWAVTLMSVAAQGYMVWRLGGLNAYLISVGLRASDWVGLGPVRTVALLLPVVNALYAVVLVSAQKATSRTRWLFAAHCVVTVTVALLSGSRNTMVGWFLVLLAIHHYGYRRLSIARAGAVFVAMLVVIVVVGAARGSYRWTSSGFEVNVQRTSWAQGNVLNYGVYPVQLVVAQEPIRLYGGATFLTAITNFVPRALWPGKPATGGVVFTRDYLFDRWRGKSYFSTGIFAEVVINFGRPFLPLGLMFLAIGLYAAARIQILAKSGSPSAAAYWAAIYGLMVPLTIGLLYLEFTNAWMLTLTRLVPFVILHRLTFAKEHQA